MFSAWVSTRGNDKNSALTMSSGGLSGMGGWAMGSDWDMIRVSVGSGWSWIVQEAQALRRAEGIGHFRLGRSGRETQSPYWWSPGHRHSQGNCVGVDGKSRYSPNLGVGQASLPLFDLKKFTHIYGL